MNVQPEKTKFENEKGASLVTSLMILTLLLGFVALVLSRTVTETILTENDASESRTFGAAQSGLESTTRDFATVMESKVAPTQSDLDTIKNANIPGFSDNFTFLKNIKQITSSEPVILSSGQYQGLYSLRDEWQIDTTAKDKTSGTEVQLRRYFLNNRIPIFQFGSFYGDDLEVYNAPVFVFNGRVHTNGNLFATGRNLKGVYFKSKVTMAGEFITDGRKQGAPLASDELPGYIFVQNATGIDKQIKNNDGSVNCTSATGNSILLDPLGRNFPYKNCTKNPNWNTFVQQFDGNLQTGVKKLTLPLDRVGKNLIEIIRRGKNIGDKANIGETITNVSTADVDDSVLSSERFANKPGIRISLADSQDKLPQCGNIALGTSCGVRLDDTLGISRGYQPLAMTDGYQATALNSNRLYVSSREVWIKIELVSYDGNNFVPVTKDVTQDILSLGVTEPAPLGSNLQIAGYNSLTDTRSVIKLQRLFMKGGAISAPTSTTYLTNASINSKNYNFVARYNVPATFTADTSTPLVNQCSGMMETSGALAGTPPACTGKNTYATPMVGGTINYSNEGQHFKLATVNSSNYFIVPFPIELFDSREGTRSSSTASSGYLYRNGVMSMIDIDVANLRRFLNGDFNGAFPTNTPFAVANGNVGLKNTDVPEARGWVVYVSDRRGDYNFDGKYKMEDIDSNGTLINEDIDNNGLIDTDYVNEAPPQDSTYQSGYAAVTDHSHYRRGVRLINGMTLPGKYDSITPSNTQGFTLASENGVYVLGNYNVQSVTLTGTTEAADSTAYFPQNSTNHIPAAIIGDAVTILSNNWNDSKSFASPFDASARAASPTQVRFALIAGDTITGRNPTDMEGYGGGLHNFMRFLEDWEVGSKRFNYSGSLVNLYNSYNNNGRYYHSPYCYDPPVRDWTFDSTFTNPDRLPPGTPYVYNLSFTGFQRVNE